MPKLKLHNGLEMPLLGFGTFQISGSDAQKSVEEAISVGYRLIDTAQYYQNESEVGAGVKATIKGGLKREDFFITTKITPKNYEDTKRAIEQSLKRLDLNYIDLLLIHWQSADAEAMWKAFEEAHDQKLVKSLGISNFSRERFSDFMKKIRIKPVLNQLETHVFFQRADYQSFLEQNGVKLQAWSPFAQGKNNFFKNEVLSKIGSKYNKTPAQIGLKYLAQRGISVIPKTTKKQRMIENISIFDFELSKEDLSLIAGLDTGKSVFGWFEG
ncbi:2,5-diketo-D-gluconic acid reductase [Campylobacter sp. MIT 99-7217]|nr:2,5-diketo-D-gluconic acid reductase [Campylobacter sp. MIT 99-7217]